MNKKIWLIFFILFYSPLVSLEVLDLKALPEAIELGNYIEILEDKSGTFGIDEILFSEKTRSLFKKNRQKIPNFGYSKSTFWIRFKINNISNQTVIKYLEYNFAPTDYITLYLQENDGKHVEKNSGDKYIFNQRDFKFNTPVFILPVKKGVNEFVLKVHTTSTVVMDLRIYSPQGLIKYINIKQIWYGIYYGIMFVMIFYNLFIYIIIRNRIYLIYVLFIVSSSVFQFSLNGLAFQFFWPDSIWMANHAVAIFLAIGLVMANLFSSLFLRIGKYSKFWERIFRIILIFSLIAIGLSFLDYELAIQYETIIAPVLLTTIFISGMISYKRGERSSKYFLLAWGLYMIGGILKSLHVNGVLPDNFITGSGFQIGSGCDVILLSLALADQLRTTRKKGEDLQMEILAIQEEQKKTLEIEVEKKTNELTEQKRKLEFRKKEYEHELEIARSIQAKLIPDVISLNNLAGIYKSMIEVGGDFYDFIAFKDSKKIGIFICDVVGHGVQAALITSVVKTLILQAGEKKENPQMLLGYLDDILCKKFDFGFITMYYGIFDPENRELISANGGHPSPILISPNGIKMLEMEKTYPAGIKIRTQIEPDINRFKNDRHILSSGSKILFYTDGLTECLSFDGAETFEDAIFFKVLEENRVFPCHVFVRNVYQAAEIFFGSSSFEDDICIICLDVV